MLPRRSGTGNLQYVFSRVRHEHGQDSANVDHHGSSRRPHSCPHARGRRSEAAAAGRAQESCERAGDGSSGSLSGDGHDRTADAAVFLQQQLPDHPDQGLAGDSRGDDPRHQNHSSQRPSASAGKYPVVEGRFSGALGRRHARRGHDELQRWRRAFTATRAATSAGTGIFISSSGSACSTKIRCSTASRSTTPLRSRNPGKVS